MATAARLDGIVNQAFSAWTIRSPQTRAAGALTVSTAITHSVTSTESARPPERVRQIRTTAVVRNPPMARTASVPTHGGAAQSDQAPTSMRVPVTYIDTMAAYQSFQDWRYAPDVRRTAKRVTVSAGVVYTPLLSTNTPRQLSEVPA